MAIIKPFKIKSFKKKDPSIEFKNVSLGFGNRLILDNINFSINKNSVHGLLGPNGAGKSTLFHLITGLLNPKNGEVKIAGTRANEYPIYLRTRKFRIGFVPQHGGAFLDLTLYDNLKAISEIVINNKNLRNEKINYLLSKFELNHLKDVKAKNLSGGEFKKCVISLALLSDPSVLLLDEPFSALDVLTIAMLQEIIINLQQETNITICICDHIASSLLQITDTAMILSNGRIVAEGSPKELVNNIAAKNAYFGDSFKIN
jgi:lipopolysaccharide export system ATP-binding protein